MVMANLSFNSVDVHRDITTTYTIHAHLLDLPQMIKKKNPKTISISLNILVHNLFHPHYSPAAVEQRPNERAGI